MKNSFILLFFLVYLVYFLRHYTEENYFDVKKIKPRQETTSDSKNYRILLIWTKGVGEKEWAKRIKNTCEKLNWQCYICSSHLNFLEKLFLRHPLKKVISTTKPDFILTLEGLKCYSDLSPHYLCLSGGIHKYLKNQGKFATKNLLKFDGFLTAFSDVSSFKNIIESNDKNFYGMHWYPTCAKEPFIQNDPKTIFYCGSNWDARRGSDEYREFFRLLDQNGYLAVYGSKSRWGFLKNSYQKEIPFDGKSMQTAMKNSGIALVLHSDSHIKGDAPSSRIFEAAAAGCVIISDRHPFVLREFSDCVLFIDHDKTAIEMFSQIDAHMRWIKSNKDKALEMSKKAHEIFLEKFSLEKHLLDLAVFHEKILAKKKEKKSVILSHTN